MSFINECFPWCSGFPETFSAASFNICAAKVDSENKVDVESQVIDQAKIKSGNWWHNLLFFGHRSPDTN